MAPLSHFASKASLKLQFATDCFLNVLHCDLYQDSVRKAVAAHPDQFVTATQLGTTMGTEEMLDAVSAHFDLPTKALM